MSCQVDQIADCGDISTLGRALFITDKEDTNWLPECAISLSSCSNLLAVGYKSRLCLLTNQWISSTDSNTFLISWSGTLPSDITALLTLPICPSQQSSQNGPDWFCIIVGFKNGSVGFYTNTGHLLLLEKLDDKPVIKISCHTGTYGTLQDDIHILFQNCECIVTGSNLFQVLRNAKAQLAKVRAGMQNEYSVDSRNINIRKWIFTDQDNINDAAVVGLDLKNTYDHLLAASTYGGYDVWYRSVPPVNTLILGTGVKPYISFHYALEGGTAPPLQDVARAVANKIKSALPGWLGGGNAESAVAANEPLVRSESLSMRNGIYDGQRHGNLVAISPDRRLAAVVDNFGRVAVLDVTRGHIIRLFKGYRDAQCAFVQIFEDDDKKPQLSVVKELKRAIFLIIYTPKKGLIDIRLMQRGNRVAVFTATKNGLLLYNTCGLVGAEKNYSYKKLNLPEFQCVLIDPDGKLKKFVIPFFYALEGEHSQRSKDLHALRDLREHLKKLSNSQDFVDELLQKASELKTLDLKKHCLDLMVRKYEVSPKIVMSCLDVFWNSIEDEKLNSQDLEIKHYFAKLGLITLFFRQINNEATEDMQHLTDKIRTFLIPSYDAETEVAHKSENDNTNIDDDDRQTNIDDAVEIQTNENPNLIHFDLLEDDNCILERLLTLAQEVNYKEHHHARVTFADSNRSTYKEFVSCFKLDERSQYIYLKSEVSPEKINDLACITFKSIFKIKDVAMLTNFVKDCNLDPKEIVKLLILQLMNMPLEEISIELIEKFIKVLYYLCSVTEEAKCIAYNETSPWWQAIRDILVDMSCPLRSMIVAMACKAVGKIFEMKCQEKEDDIWESVTKENAKWGILIGKLEDISILTIILMFNESFTGDSIEKLKMSEFNINLKYIYTRGKGSVTELIAKWLCGMGVVPEAVVANELIEKYSSLGLQTPEPNDDDDSDYLFIENNRNYVDENPKIFKWLSLLRQQFPLSTSADYIIANMCWEYAMAWQKSMQNCEYLKTVLRCLTYITNLHIRLGLFSIIWSTYIKHVFEISCRLVNKVGRLPKDPLCLQDVGFDSTTMIMFLQCTTTYLDRFVNCSSTSVSQKKLDINFEKIWDESTPSLVEVAQDTKNINNDILNLNHQISCTVYYMCHYNVKMSKPLDSLYDVDYHYVLEALGGNVVSREINMKASDKLRNPRMKFITKLIRAAVETITTSDDDVPYTAYNCEECIDWIEKINILSELWSINVDFVRRQQVISLYHLGYDLVAENIIGLIEEPDVVLPPILAITTQRFKRCLEHSMNQPEWIVSLPPQLFKRIRMADLDTSIPAHPSLETTQIVLQKVISQMEKKAKNNEANAPNIKITELFIESCDVLVRRKL